ncbi:hypothetical protein NPIL_265591, partial [Nephila pilipes]
KSDRQNIQKEFPSAKKRDPNPNENLFFSRDEDDTPAGTPLSLPHQDLFLPVHLPFRRRGLPYLSPKSTIGDEDVTRDDTPRPPNVAGKRSRSERLAGPKRRF